MGFQPAVCTLLRYSARNNDEGSKENEELMATVIYIYGWDVEALVNSRPLTHQSANCSDYTLINRQLVES